MASCATVTQLLAWVWAPLVLYGLALGAGLLVDRLLGADLPRALIAPAGLAIVVVLATLGYRARLPSLVPPALVLLALAGLFAARGDLRRLAPGGPALAAGVAVYGVYVAPAVLTGEATWLGYNFVNDTASNFLLTELLGSHGAVAPSEQSGGANVARYLIDIGYPLGAFSAIAAVKPLAGLPVEAVYQPLMAAMAGLGAMSLSELARRAGLRPAAAVVAVVLAFSGVLLYRYSLHGAVKEVLVVSLLVTAVALTAIALDRRLPVRLVLLVGVACLSMVLVFSTAAAAFALALGVGAAVVAARSPGRRPTMREALRVAGVLALVGFIGAIPVLGSLLDFTQNIRSVFDASGGASTGEFGQLVRPLPVTEAAGVWLGRDYRFPASSSFNTPLVAAAVVTAVAGVLVSVARRRWEPLLLLATVLGPALLISPLASPYIDGKMLVIATPVVVFLAAFAALTGVQSAGVVRRAAGGLGLAALAVGVLASAAYSYRDARPAPIDRVEAMKDVAAAVPDRGLYLLNVWEEYGKVFMGDARINPAAESDAPRKIALRADAGLEEKDPRRTPIVGQSFDLDRQTLDYVQGFRGVIMRRSPVASRPPASFRLIYRNRYYELWHRRRDVRVLDHLSLQGPDRATAIPDCGAVRRMARKAPQGARIVGAARQRVARFTPREVDHPRNWPVAGGLKRAVTTAGPGTLRGTLSASGRQRLWLRANAPRDLSVSVDGRPIGTVRQINTPDQWLSLGPIVLGPGRHRIEVRRGTAGWGPGDGVYGHLGPVALQAVGRDRLVSVAPSDAGRLCGRAWDWVETVVPAR